MSWGNYERNSEYSGRGTCPDCHWRGERLHQHNCGNPGSYRRQQKRIADLAAKTAAIEAQNQLELKQALRNSIATIEAERIRLINSLTDQLRIEQESFDSLRCELQNEQALNDAYHCKLYSGQKINESLRAEIADLALKLATQSETSCSSAKRARCG